MRGPKREKTKPMRKYRKRRFLPRVARWQKPMHAAATPAAIVMRSGPSGSYRYAQRAVGHPDAAYRPRAHESDVLEVVILVALKVFFEKFLYKHAYDGYYRNNRRRAQIRIRKHKAPLPQKLNKTNKAAVTLRYPLLSYHKKRRPQDGFAPRRLPRQSNFSDALKA